MHTAASVSMPLVVGEVPAWFMVLVWAMGHSPKQRQDMVCESSMDRDYSPYPVYMKPSYSY